ncbi:MAG: hypothetical protein GTN89_06995 [Acidobacteria bacterium]|nr:hypothetical protein [Acidobacteriota bacterium]NIM62768.1 hypothetical protein [Acidobacteriota bacterium]NIO59068.1 hypothetical protein [Acidobacteriota bacterium]NIQ30107.1 hypothetical protein [Acidobacteriota bacterium]NIQ84910.1 hypothetical protein [Acidobacteriota bacterium]
MSGFDERKEGTGDSVETVADLLEKTSRDHGGGPVEYFHRSSRSLRLSWNCSSGEVDARRGTEEGGALRWLDPRRDCVGFAASSGDVLASLVACRTISAETPETPVDACPWNTAAEPIDDIDAPAKLPSPEEMELWLRANTPETAESAWIEAGCTCEAWSTGRATVQTRSRTRVWALWMPENDPRPMFLAARCWREWLGQDVAAAWADRDPGSPRDASWPDDAKVVFSPETSAFVGRALVGALHGPDAELGFKVGSGWVVRSNADPATSLFGSVSDDAGFPPPAGVLADGRHVVGNWVGPGNLRRGSFRDLPESKPVCLEIDPPRIDPPKRSVWVSRLSLHPAEDGWLVELHGRQYPDGASFRPRWAHVRPQRIVESCLGGIGPGRTSHHGTISPSLVFDAWLFKG